MPSVEIAETCDMIGCDMPEYADGVCRRHQWLVRQDEVIYFIECGDFIKIGFSRNLKPRLEALSSSSPYGMKLLATIRGGSKDQERELHEVFATAHHRGEWFRKTPELLKFVESLA